MTDKIINLTAKELTNGLRQQSKIGDNFIELWKNAGKYFIRLEFIGSNQHSVYPSSIRGTSQVSSTLKEYRLLYNHLVKFSELGGKYTDLIVTIDTNQNYQRFFTVEQLNVAITALRTSKR